MTEGEIILVDKAIKKMPMDKPVDMYLFYDLHQLKDIQGRYSEEIYNEIKTILTTNKELIISYLIKEKFIQIFPSSYTVKYILSENGMKARELNGYKNFLEWKIQENKKINKLNFAQRYWWQIALVVGIIGWFGDLGKQVVILKYIQPKTIEQKGKDTIPAIE